MNIKEVADHLNGMQYPIHMPDEYLASLRKSNIVVVMGASDDLVNFVGAIYDEYYIGHSIYLDQDGLIISKCDEGDECPNYQDSIKHSYKIVGSFDNYHSYETNIENYETFDIYDEDELYCKAIVFNLNDL